MRIYTKDNQPLDFCPKCIPTPEDALAQYGPDRAWYQYDAPHPPYGAGFNCAGCGAQLEEPYTIAEPMGGNGYVPGYTSSLPDCLALPGIPGEVIIDSGGEVVYRTGAGGEWIAP